MTPGVPPRLPLLSQRLVVVTGKGGVGKTTVTAALAYAAAASERRVLAVEVGRGSLGSLLGGIHLGAEPMRVRAGLAAASLEPEVLLGDFVEGVLRFRILARRLLESTSFQVLAAAAPGLGEFLVLHRLLGWVEARRRGRPVYDLVVVDAPASGHSLPLLAAPHTLGALARLGPVAELLARIQRLIADPGATLVCVVTTPEELAVRETVELHRELAGRLGLAVAPPIVNALPPRRFTARDAVALDRLEAASGPHPYLYAARFQLERRRQADAQLTALRRARGRGGPPRPADGRADRRSVASPEGRARPLRARRPSEPRLARRDRGARCAPRRAPPRREADLRRAGARARHHSRAGARRAREPALPEPLRHARRHGRVHGSRAGLPAGGRGRLRPPGGGHAARTPRGRLPGRAAPAGAPPRLARLRHPEGPDQHPPRRRLAPGAAHPRRGAARPRALHRHRPRARGGRVRRRDRGPDGRAARARARRRGASHERRDDAAPGDRARAPPGRRDRVAGARARRDRPLHSRHRREPGARPRDVRPRRARPGPPRRRP